jgi:tetratricopeptide (TPR) repeat protein
MRGNLRQAIDLIDHGIALAEDDDERLDLLIEKARYLGEVGAVDEAIRILDRCDSLNADERRSAAVTIERAKIALSLDRVEDAKQKAPQDFDGLGESIQYEAASLLGGIAATEGRLADAGRWTAQAQDLADSSGRASRQLTARRRRAIVLGLRGRVAEALSLNRYVHDRYRQLGYRKGIIESGLNLLFLMRWTGDLVEGVALGYELLAIPPEPTWTAMTLTNLADLELELGRSDASDGLAERAAHLPEAALSWALTDAHILLARSALDRRDVAAVQANLDAAVGTPALPEHRLALETIAMDLARLTGDEVAFAHHRAVARALLETPPDGLRVGEERRLVLSEDLPPATVRTKLDRLLDRALSGGMKLEEARLLMALGRHDEARAIFEQTQCGRGLRELERQLSLRS